MERSKFVVDLSDNYDKESFKSGLKDVISVITSLMEGTETDKGEIENALSFIKHLVKAANEAPKRRFSPLRLKTLSEIDKLIVPGAISGRTLFKKKLNSDKKCIYTKSFAAAACEGRSGFQFKVSLSN